MKPFLYILLSLTVYTDTLFGQPETHVIQVTNGGSLDLAVFGDLNNDLVDDCAMLIDNHLVWYTMDTTGYWAEQHVLEQWVSKRITDLYIADIDGDGWNDLVFQYIELPSFQFTFGWYLNTGTDDLMWTENLSGIYQNKIAGFADIDTDGDADVIDISNYNDLRLLINNSGTFMPPVTLVPAVGYFKSSDRADIDNDGLLDLALYTSDAIIRYLHNNGDGTISIQTIESESVHALRLGDINTDGYPDIVYQYGDIYYHAYNPDTDTFGPAQLIGEMPILPFSCGDFDGDSDVDIYFVEISPLGEQRVRVLFNTGFDTPADAVTVLDTLLESAYIAIADINADSKMDVLEGLKKKVDAYLQMEDGSFSENYEPNTTYNRIVYSEWIDINGDDVPDLLECNEEGVIRWMEYDPATNTILNRHAFPKNEASPSPVGVLADDIDDDGDMDVIAGFRIAPEFEHWSYYYLNDGAGHFSMKQFSTNAYTQMVLLDGNEDGDKDLVALKTNGFIYIFENTGDTASLFASAILISSSVSNSFDTTDINDDGRMDIVASKNMGEVQKIINAAGPAYFNPSADYFDAACPYSSNSIYCDDYDGDGDIDIIYSCNESSNAYIAQKEGAVFTHIPIGSMRGSSSADPFINQLADVNNDGNNDLICSVRDEGTYIKFSTADGFLPDYYFLQGVFGHFISMDGDAWPDILAAEDFKWYVSYDAAYYSGFSSLSAPTLSWLAENGAADTLVLTLSQIPAAPLTLTVIPHIWLNTGAGTGVTHSIIIPDDSTALLPIVIPISNTHADSFPEQITTGTVQFIFDPFTWGLAAASLDTTITYTLTDDDPKLFLSTELVYLPETTTFTNVTANLNVYQPTASWLNIDPDDHISTIDGEGETSMMLIAGEMGSIASYTFNLRNLPDNTDEPDMTEWVHFSVSSDMPLIDTMVTEPLEAHLIDNDISDIEHVFPSNTTHYTEGDNFVIKFKLLSAPVYDVDIIAQPDAQLDLGEGAGQPYTFHFSGGDFVAGFKYRTVTAVLDGITEGEHTGAISYTIITDDTLYAALTIPNTSVILEDAWLSLTDTPAETLSITPTAGNGHITINASDVPGIKQVTVYAANGAAVFTGSYTGDHLNLDLSAQPAGSYWVTVSNDSAVKSGRFSIVH